MVPPWTCNDAWAHLLLFNRKIRYHYVAYEQLISQQRDAYFTELAHIAGAPGPLVDRPFAELSEGLVSLHEPTCEERVAGYAQLATQLLGTRTYWACLMLAAKPLLALPDEFGLVSPFWGIGSGCKGAPCKVGIAKQKHKDNGGPA